MNEIDRVTPSENSQSYIQVIEGKFFDRVTRDVGCVVVTIDSDVHDAILTAKDSVFKPRVGLLLRLITAESSGRGNDSAIGNPKGEKFPGSTGYTPLMTASSRTKLNISLHNFDESRVNATIEDVDVPSLRLNYDR